MACCKRNVNQVKPKCCGCGGANNVSPQPRQTIVPAITKNNLQRIVKRT